MPTGHGRKWRACSTMIRRRGPSHGARLLQLRAFAVGHDKNRTTAVPCSAVRDKRLAREFVEIDQRRTRAKRAIDRARPVDPQAMFELAEISDCATTLIGRVPPAHEADVHHIGWHGIPIDLQPEHADLAGSGSLGEVNEGDVVADKKGVLVECIPMSGIFEATSKFRAILEAVCRMIGCSAGVDDRMPPDATHHFPIDGVAVFPSSAARQSLVPFIFHDKRTVRCPNTSEIAWCNFVEMSRIYVSAIKRHRCIRVIMFA